MRNILDEALSFVEKHPQLSSSIPDEGKNTMIDATLGLTLTEGRRIFSKAMLTDHLFEEKDIDLILFEKKQLIRKSGSLEYFDANESIANVGGMNALKKWLTARRESYTTKARKFGLPMPKGLLLLGVQGCGKSLTSKAVASLWRQPLLRLDMGRIFSSYIGSSEENMRKAIATAESLAPVILWIDEIEKGFSGAEIEMAIVEAMYTGFAAKRDFNTEDILEAISATVPLSKTMAEDIAGLRHWAKERARPASE